VLFGGAPFNDAVLDGVVFDGAAFVCVASHCCVAFH
jgi:hypothetical protein